MKIKLAITDYNKLVNRQNSIADKIAKVSREKDLKVDTINKKYENKLDKLIREQREVDLIVTQTKAYVQKN